MIARNDQQKIKQNKKISTTEENVMKTDLILEKYSKNTWDKLDTFLLYYVWAYVLNES